MSLNCLTGVEFGVASMVRPGLAIAADFAHLGSGVLLHGRTGGPDVLVPHGRFALGTLLAASDHVGHLLKLVHATLMGTRVLHTNGEL